MDVGQEDQQSGELLAAFDDAELGRLLDRIGRVAAGVGKTDDLRLRRLCLQQERGEILGIQRHLHATEDLAAVAYDSRRGVALQRGAERIVGGDEKPGISPLLGDRGAGAIGQHPGVIGPVHRVGRARLAGQIRCARSHRQECLAFVPGDLVDRQRDPGVRHVDDRIDVVHVVPLARDVRADVRLVLVVGGHDLHLVTTLLDTRVFDRHLRRSHRAGAGEVRVQTRHVGKHADLDHAVRDLRLRRTGAKRRHEREAVDTAFETIHPSSLVVSQRVAHHTQSSARRRFRRRGIHATWSRWRRAVCWGSYR